MRPIRLSAALFTLLLASCATVKVAPQREDQLPPPPTRSDQARTDDFPAADNDGYRPPARLALVLPASVQLVLEPGKHGAPDDPEDAISFYPQGYSSGGLIRLGASGGRQFEISVDWLTGRVQLQ